MTMANGVDQYVNSQPDRVRPLLSNRMAEIQVAPGFPDQQKRTKIDTGYGEVTLIQQSVSAGLKDEKDLELSEIKHVTLTVEWTRGGPVQSRRIEFYVYRPG